MKRAEVILTLGGVMGLCYWLILTRSMGCSGCCSARAGSAASLVRQIEVAAGHYEKENGVYPPGNGLGSEAAYRVLTVPGPSGLPYIQRTFTNPIDNSEAVSFLSPGVMNRGRVDIWCSDCDGNRCGINNW